MVRFKPVSRRHAKCSKSIYWHRPTSCPSCIFVLGNFIIISHLLLSQPTHSTANKGICIREKKSQSLPVFIRHWKTEELFWLRGIVQHWMLFCRERKSLKWLVWGGQGENGRMSTQKGMKRRVENISSFDNGQLKKERRAMAEANNQKSSRKQVMEVSAAGISVEFK